jgi:hypothetical protein
MTPPGRDLGDTAKQPVPSQDRGQQVQRIDPVLQDQNHGLRPQQRRYLLRSGLGVPELDGKQHQIDRAEIRGTVAGPGRHAQLAPGPADDQTLRPDRLKMPATRQSDHLVASFGKLGAKARTHASGSHKTDPHAHPPFDLILTLILWSCTSCHP